MKRTSRQAFGPASSSLAVRRPVKTIRRTPISRPVASFGFRGSRPGQKEKKYTTVSISTGDVFSTWNVFCINKVAVGDNYTDRDGRQILVKSIQIKANLQPTDGGTVDHIHRFIVFVDKQNNSNDPEGNGAPAQAEMALLLDSVGNMHSLLNPTQAGRFQVLKDYNFVVSGTTGDRNPKCFRDFKLFKKVNIPVMYSGSTAAASAIMQNAIYVAYASGCTTGNGDQINGQVRIRFTDV